MSWRRANRLLHPQKRPPTHDPSARRSRQPWIRRRSPKNYLMVHHLPLYSLQYLNSNRADTCSAILLRTKPTLTPLLLPNVGESAILGFTLGTLKSRLLPLTASPDLTEQILYIWLRLRYLTEFLASIPSTDRSKIDSCLFSDKTDAIERHTLSLLHSDTLAECKEVAFLTAFLNAALIFIYEEMRECPKWTNICICLSQRIYSGLEMLDLGVAARLCPDLLLWVLMLGRSGVNPLGGPSKPWFSNVIADIEHTFLVKVPDKAWGLTYFLLAESLGGREDVGIRDG